MDRRSLLKAVAALACAPLVAAKPSFAVPRVDRLSLTILMDGQVALFGIPVTRPGFALVPAPRLDDPAAALLAQWGYSVAVAAEAGGTTRTTLVDAGYTGDALANNMALLGIAPASIDAVVISHGHQDHWGGLPALLDRRELRRGTPVFIGGEEAFCERVRGITAGAPSFGRLDRTLIAAAGLRLVNGGVPAIAGNGFTTGTIPLASPERPKVPTAMLPGRGCERDALDADKRGDFVVDDAAHELGVAFHLAGRGLIVIGSCSHRGIINTVLRARAITGIEKVHAIIGGFHLVPPQTPAQVTETVALMRAIDPDYVIPGHCTGEPFIAAIDAALSGRVFRSTVGTRFEFSA
jgi:7,8-dihydropterin-6-yl-methyl-4-(beta-D-ribofuranosyl)aminobenzene 5'-phosphate synthase